MSQKKRDVSLDFLRGLAVIFMVMQHIAVWLWDAGWSKSMSLFAESPVYISLIAFSALSAPVFIFCAGCGAWLFMNYYQDDAKIVRRGLILLAVGYFTVITIDSWFSWGSWYVLQSLGFCFLTVPLLRRLKKYQLVIISILIAAVSVAGQYILQTPLAYGNHRMADLSLTLAPLRLALFEGHFPVFPWWGIFVAGYFVGDLVKSGEYRLLLKPAFVLAFAGLLFIATGYFFPNVLYKGIGNYIFSFRVRFYPLLFPVLLLLLSASLMSLYLAHFFCSKFRITQANPVTAIGRLALTAFISHIYIKEFVYTFGYVQGLGKWQTIAVTTSLLAFYAALSLFLRKYKYRFTLEWIFRKLG